MIKRIVKLTIKENDINTFKALFLASKPTILSFNCTYVECLQSEDDPAIFFTYSHWDSVASLNEYRHSDEFTEIWKSTKMLFAEKAKAWSTQEITKL